MAVRPKKPLHILDETKEKTLCCLGLEVPRTLDLNDVRHFGSHGADDRLDEDRRVCRQCVGVAGGLLAGMLDDPGPYPENVMVRLEVALHMGRQGVDKTRVLLAEIAREVDDG